MPFRSVNDYARHPLLFQRDGHLTIDSKSGLQVLRPRDYQEEVHAHWLQSRWIDLLKSRQMGSSTEIAATTYTICIMRPGTRAVIVAHTAEAAEHIFNIYKTFQEFCPSQYKVKTKNSSTRTLTFANRSFIRVATAGSESIRGSTYDIIHLSEGASYPHFRKFLAAALQCAVPNALVAIETTAKGLGEYSSFWADKFSGWKHLFFPWMRDPTYVSNAYPDPPPTPYELDRVRLLTSQQANYWIWHFRTKCGSDPANMGQEMPMTAEEAFIAEGTPYLRRFLRGDIPIADPQDEGWWYEDASWNKTINGGKPCIGLSTGIDVASGSPEPSADRTAIAVTYTRKVEGHLHTKLVAAWRGKVLPSAVIDIIKPLIAIKSIIVPERNTYGLKVVEDLMGYEHLYADDKFTGAIKPTHPTQMGFATTPQTRPLLFSDLAGALVSGKLEQPIGDPRTLYELAALEVSGNTRPEAGGTNHDDSAVALALALQGVPFLSVVQGREDAVHPPEGIREILLWERQRGELYIPEGRDEGGSCFDRQDY